MPSQVSICNRALIRCGASRISALSQDTPNAIRLNAIYVDIRDDVLRAHPWNFAIKRVILAPNASAPAWGYDFEFDVPNDCLRVLPDVRDAQDQDGVDHVVESDDTGNSRKIRTNESEIHVRYIFRHENEVFWDSNFCNALAWKLATELAYALTQSVSLKQECEKSYRAALAEARSIDGMEGSAPQLIADDWSNSRL